MSDWLFGMHVERDIDQTKKVECDFCRSDFLPRWYPVPGDPALYRRQRFCTELCRKLWQEERKEATDQ